MEAALASVAARKIDQDAAAAATPEPVDPFKEVRMRELGRRGRPCHVTPSLTLPTVRWRL